MTVAELIIELRKLDQSTEVWVDTAQGLMAVDNLYGVINGDINTAIITYSDNEYEGIKQ
jgi:hypothetical protein